MNEYEQVIWDLIEPLVDTHNIQVKQQKSLDDNEILIYIYGDSKSLGKLIGHQGTNAKALYKMASLKAKLNDHHLTIKYENY